MSDSNFGVTQAQLEIEIEREIEQKGARVVSIGAGALFLAWVVASAVNIIFGIEFSLQFIVAAITPLVVFIALRVTYISTIERQSRLKQSQRVSIHKN